VHTLISSCPVICQWWDVWSLILLGCTLSVRAFNTINWWTVIKVKIKLLLLVVTLKITLRACYIFKCWMAANKACSFSGFWLFSSISAKQDDHWRWWICPEPDASTCVMFVAYLFRVIVCFSSSDIKKQVRMWLIYLADQIYLSLNRHKPKHRVFFKQVHKPRPLHRWRIAACWSLSQGIHGWWGIKQRSNADWFLFKLFYKQLIVRARSFPVDIFTDSPLL